MNGVRAGTERRKWARLPLAIPVFVRSRDRKGKEFLEFATALNVSAGGMLQELAAATGKRIVFYCAFGERSAMAVAAAQAAGLTSACHIEGGIAAWKKANGPLAR